MKVNIGKVVDKIVCQTYELSDFLAQYHICNIYRMSTLNRCLYDLSGVEAYNMGKYAEINENDEYFQLNLNDAKLSRSFNTNNMENVVDMAEIHEEIERMCKDGYIFRYLEQADKNYHSLWHLAKQIDYVFEWGAHTITTDYFHKDLVEALVKIPIEDNNITTLAKEICKIDSLRDYVRIKLDK